MIRAMADYETLHVRVPETMAEELDWQVEALSGEQPGMTWNRSSVVRTALVAYFRSEDARREGEA
jgi:Arc/MetJ-type ribon-helix-helix transcriptional regulator